MDSANASPATGLKALPLRQSAEDWVNAFRMWRLWTSLAWEDLSDRYRRTVFGLSWVVASFVLFIVVYITIFGQVSGVSQAQYTLYVTVGFALWTFISGAATDACVAYTGATNWMLGTAIPYPAFFLQGLVRDWLVFITVLVVLVLMLVWMKPHWSATMLWAIPGLLSYLIAPLWLSAILAPLCARYRDITHAIQTLLRIMFFVTPILWLPQQRPGLATIAKYNIITHYIDIVRSPLIYDVVPYKSWIVVLTANAIGIAIGFLVYAATRNRVVYWL